MAGSILFGIPLHKPHDSFLCSLPKFILQCSENYNIKVKVVEGKSLVEAQNEIANYFIDNTDCSHLLFLEDDHSGHTVEMLHALLKPNVDVCGMNYYCRWYPYYACNMEEIYSDRDNQRFAGIEQEGGYRECDLVGFGMTLYNRKVFKVLPRPYFTLNKRGERYAKSYATDEDFCDRLKQHGFKITGCFEYTLTHRGITKENVKQIRDDATLRFHNLKRIQMISRKDFEITEEMVRGFVDSPIRATL